MAKKKRKNKMSPERKMMKKGLGIVKAVVIGVSAGHGVIRAGIESNADNTWAKFGSRTTYYYSGFNPNDGTFNSEQAINSALTIGLGVGVAKLISWAGKSV